MPILTLTDDDAGTLRKVLEGYLTDLRMEIADTDSQPFRENLKREEVLIGRLIAQLRTQDATR